MVVMWVESQVILSKRSGEVGGASVIHCTLGG